MNLTECVLRMNATYDAAHVSSAGGYSCHRGKTSGNLLTMVLLDKYKREVEMLREHQRLIDFKRDHPGLIEGLRGPENARYRAAVGRELKRLIKK